jgi:hypothetical protein
MNSIANSPAVTALPALHFRERVLDDNGEPLDGELPENWELADSRLPDLLRIGQGQLLITSADDLAFVRETLLPGWERGDDVVIRATYTQAAQIRMGDFLVALIDGALAVTYEVLVTGEDIPHLLNEPGEMCLALRADLSLLWASLAGQSGNA